MTKNPGASRSVKGLHFYNAIIIMLLLIMQCYNSFNFSWRKDFQEL